MKTFEQINKWKFEKVEMLFQTIYYVYDFVMRFEKWWQICNEISKKKIYSKFYIKNWNVW